MSYHFTSCLTRLLLPAVHCTGPRLGYSCGVGNYSIIHCSTLVKKTVIFFLIVQSVLMFMVSLALQLHNFHFLDIFQFSKQLL